MSATSRCCCCCFVALALRATVAFDLWKPDRCNYCLDQCRGPLHRAPLRREERRQRPGRGTRGSVCGLGGREGREAHDGARSSDGVCQPEGGAASQRLHDGAEGVQQHVVPPAAVERRERDAVRRERDAPRREPPGAGVRSRQAPHGLERFVLGSNPWTPRYHGLCR
jgi:hypothetical protein